MNLQRFFIVLISLFGFNSCKNDLKVNAPYKEIPSVYAVLNPQEKVQIIRVNKVFLGEGDANKMAQISDSINYPAGEITVTLNRFLNGVQVDANPILKKRTIVFRDSMILASEGAFNRNQRVYVAYDDLHVDTAIINPSTGLNINQKWKVEGDYVLTIKNNRTGNIFTAKSTILDSVRLSGFPPFAPPFYPVPPGVYPATNTGAYLDYSSQTQDPKNAYTTRYSPNDGKIYNLAMRLHFFEDLGLQGKVNRYVDYVFGNQLLKDITPSPTGEKYLVNTFLGRDLFSNVGLSLSKLGLTDNLIGRKMYKIQFFVYTSTQDYDDYLKFSAPSFNISQNKPLYSNFDNKAALGLFTFRSRCSVVKDMAAAFVNEFAYNANTCKYKFMTFDNLVPGCK